jgi:4-alpha-glucanotransferase
VATREGESPWVPVHVPHGAGVSAWVETEDGGFREVQQQDRWVEPRTVDGSLVGEATFAVPGDLPLGWHLLRVTAGGVEASCHVVVTPRRLTLHPALADRQSWGFAAQLYSVRSQHSWGLGDLADLGELADWSGRDLGADFVLVNPLHAAQVSGRMEPSPYLPTTRRFVNPVYIRVEDVRETGYLHPTDRALVQRQAEALRASSTSGDQLDRDAVWEAKKVALETVYRAGRTPARQSSFDAFRRREGQGLRDYATWCALSEKFGMPPSSWPEAAHDHSSELLATLRTELATRVTFHEWLQWVADAQLEAAQRTALDAGMAAGVVHDLAVGVHPEGADTWTLQGVLAQGVSVGAPPDAYNQQGQDWSQPPWRPDALAELAYAPYRDMLRTVLRHAGGLRVDHVIGLFRLWWVPQGRGPTEGTYVRYDHDALVGILALEAHRAGAFVVGEDLGTVEPWVRDYLGERGILGTSVLWFEKDDEGQPLRPESWRELCLASVTTHDLPPTAGYLAGEHVELRQRLGLLTRELATEMAADAADRAAVLTQLREKALLPADPTERQTVEALHRFLTWTPSRLVGVSLADAVGDRRAQNQPGTSTQYPNWKLPLADGEGSPVLLEDLRASSRAAALAAVVSARGHAPGPPGPGGHRPGSPG